MNRTKDVFFTPWRLACLGVLLLSGAVYAPALPGAPIWDDVAILGGEGIGGGKSLASCFVHPFLGIYFRPLTSASFFLEKRLSGGTPWFYHQTNILIHVATTAILLCLLLAAFERRRVALIGALLFAVQPVQVSTVAWIGGRTDSLCALLVALYAWGLICAAKSRGRRAAGLTAASALAFLAAALTKEQILPAVLLVPLALRCWSEPGDRSRWRLFSLWLPYIYAVALFVLTYALAKPPSLAVAATATHSLGPLLPTVVYYAFVLFAPAPTWMHSVTLGGVLRLGWAANALGIGLSAGAAILFRRCMRTCPPAAWFLAFTVLTLAPVLNLLPVPSLPVCPYRAGVAGLGAAALAAWAADRIWSRLALLSLEHRPRVRPLGSMTAVAGVAAVAWCVGLSWWGSARFSRQLEIDRTFLRYDPDSLWVRHNLAGDLAIAGRFGEAAAELEDLLNQVFGSSVWRDPRKTAVIFRSHPAIRNRVLALNGSRLSPETWICRALAQLGEIRLDMGHLAASRAAFLAGETIEPRCAEVQAGFGELAYQSHDYAEAERRELAASALDPKLPEPLTLLGKTYLAVRRWRDAEAAFRRAIALTPWTSGNYTGLADAQEHLGDIEGAVVTLRKSLSARLIRTDTQARLAALERRRGREKPGPAVL